MRSKHEILLNQRKYTLELISELGLSGAKQASTPLEANVKLTSVEYDATCDKEDDSTGRKMDDPALGDIGKYQKLVGKLIYLTITTPDICFAVQVLSQFMQMPKKSHWDATLRIVRYVKRSPRSGILLRRNFIEEMTVFCDSNWVSCPNTRRSVSKKQYTISRSSAKAEYRNMTSAVSEIVWLTGLLKDLGVDIKLPIKHNLSDSVSCVFTGSLESSCVPFFPNVTYSCCEKKPQYTSSWPGVAGPFGYPFHFIDPRQDSLFSPIQCSNVF
ncbi:uncharacterized mitochondrial protein AtMg00810-like [Lycium barbarum]|uniref:uncharacterized mitochondrial protein AtMg00810-like n=1 Tax=Lycium barbarum TaxID=112863 RepID=UPI00293EDDCD|nr:uncharacterized mitochondrial protein AtMg00810-like [Lycium barbarum]